MLTLVYSCSAIKLLREVTMGLIRLKNVFGEPWKQSYRDIKISPRPTLGFGMAASPSFIAFPWDVAGGGVVAVTPIEVVGRDTKSTKIKAHSGAIMDMVFNEFVPNVLATGSDDNTVKLWDVSCDVAEISKHRACLDGHMKKLVNIAWNPTTDFILLSGAFDGLVKVWDAANENEIVSISVDDQVTSVAWSPEGDGLVVATKESNVHLIDPRAGKSTSVFKAHPSNKVTHALHLSGDYGNNNLITTGFVGNQTRQIRVWDPRNTTKHLITKDVDSSSSPMIPHWDPLTGLFCIASKGDLTVRVFQFFENELYRAGEFRTSGCLKSFCWIPSVACDKSKCELERFLSNEDCKQINATSVVIMRRNSELSMKEIYGASVVQSRRCTTAVDWTKSVFSDEKSAIYKQAKEPTEYESKLNGIIEKLNKINTSLITNESTIATLKMIHADLECLVAALTSLNLHDQEMGSDDDINGNTSE